MRGHQIKQGVNLEGLITDLQEDIGLSEAIKQSNKVSKKLEQNMVRNLNPQTNINLYMKNAQSEEEKKQYHAYMEKMQNLDNLDIASYLNNIEK